MQGPIGKSGVLGKAGIFGGTTGGNTFALIQKVGTFCNGSTSCSFTVSSTGSNHLLIMAAVAATGGVGSVITGASTGSSSWVAPVGCQANNASVGTISCAYAACNSTSGVTTINLTLADTNPYRIVFYEYSASTVSCSLDGTAQHASNTGNGTTIAGVTLTGTSGTSDLVNQWIATGATVTAVASPYGNLTTSSTVAGYADNENTSSPSTAPVWSSTYSANPSLEGAMGFK